MSQGQNDGSGNKNSYSGEGNIIDWYVQKTHYKEEKKCKPALEKWSDREITCIISKEAGD